MNKSSPNLWGFTIRCLKLLPLILALPLCAQAAEQQMFKCKDTAGRITYSGKPCNELGLSSAGEVTGRASVTPALRVLPSATRTYTPPAAPDAPAKAVEPAKQGVDAAPATGEKRCFSVKTAKGTTERCNDTPE